MAEHTYRIHVAAQLSGVRTELIRAWERRYGVLTPRRTPSGYRVYTERDVALLKRLKQLTEQGVSISEAATMLPQLLVELEGASASPSPSLTSLGAWREEVLRAAQALDQRRVAEVLDEVLATLSPLKAFEEVLAPLQREVGERWHAGTFTVGQEHLVTQVVRARIINLLHAAPDRGSRHAVLACFPDEQHELGLLGTALRLRHSDFSVTLLGQRVPPEDVGRMASALKAHLVGLSAVMDNGLESFTSSLSRVLEGVPRGIPVWAGGPAARRYREAAERLGARVFDGEQDWSRLLE